MTENALGLEQEVNLPDGFVLRGALQEDIPAIVAMVNASSQAIEGRNSLSVEELAHGWESEVWSAAKHARVVAAPDGQIVGYTEVWNVRPPKVRPFVMEVVHPEYTHLPIGTAMVTWAEAVLRGELDQAPEGARVEMLASANLKDQADMKLLTDYGFEITRYFWNMVIDLDGALPEAQWPEGITVRTLRPDEDEREAYKVVRASFQDHWGYTEAPFEEAYHAWEHMVLTQENYDRSLRFLAMDGDRIVGVSLCQPSEGGNLEMGWVATLGVIREYRGKGIAKALLYHSFGEFYRRGKKSVGLGVDAASLTGATKLYESVGMRVTQQYANFSKELRAGVDLSKK